MATLNRKELSDFLAEFDPVKKKYEIDDKLEFDLYKRVYDFESTRQFAYIFKREYDTSYDNVKLIYNSSPKDASDIVNIYVNTRKKIVERYLNIKGLEQLFSELFLEFEWDLHSSIKVDEGKHRFYRDHFIHQIRVLFELEKMLDDFGYLNDIKDTILQNQTNKVCRYIKNQVDLEVERVLSSIKERNIWLEIYQKDCTDKNVSEESTDKISSEGSTNNRISVELKFDENKFSEWLTERILLIFIRQATYVAALFHDIGYPIAHSVNIHKRIFDYATDIYASSSFANIDFQEIEKSLGKSLLFQIIKNENIKQSFEKLDHGTLSAIVFLLHFYKGNSLTSQTPLQVAIIEIAALAMHNHTLKYEQFDGKVADYFRPVYKNNPIAFLLRVADDVQEWDRIYFEFKKNKNFYFCNKCKTPIISTTIREGTKKTKSYSLCKCNYSKALGDHKHNCSYYNNLNINCDDYYEPEMFMKESDLQTHSISIIKMCSSANFEKQENITGRKFNVITLNYDPYYLLLRTMSDSHFSEYTCKDFRNLKKKMQGQIEIVIDYFLTSNPISLKVKILQLHFIKWLNNDKKIDIYKDSINNEVFDEYKKELKKIVKEIEIHLDDDGERKKYNIYIKDIIKRITIYYNLLKYWYKCWNKLSNKIAIPTNVLAKNDMFQNVYKDAISDLKHFPFLGFSSEVLRKGLDNENYLELLRKEKEEKVLDSISAYTQIISYDGVPYEIENGKIYLDFYSDLYFFKLIHDKIKEESENNAENR